MAFLIADQISLVQFFRILGEQEIPGISMPPCKINETQCFGQPWSYWLDRIAKAEAALLKGGA